MSSKRYDTESKDRLSGSGASLLPLLTPVKSLGLSAQNGGLNRLLYQA
jgi:hypothetical protein